MDAAIRQEAVRAFKNGWVIIPLRKDSKEPNTSIKPYLHRRPTKEEYGRFNFGNYGIVTGEVSGITVLDIDGQDGWDTLERLGKYIKDIATPRVLTPREGGEHFYFRYNPNIPHGTNVYGKGIDVRNDGGYVVGAGSRIASKEYRWNPTYPISEALSEPPDWLVRGRSEVLSPTPERVSIGSSLTEGERNDKMFKLACKLVHADIPPDFVLDTLHYLNQRLVRPELSLDELQYISNSAERYREGKD